MKLKAIIAGIGLFAGLVGAEATVINIPDGTFQNVNAVLNGPPIGVARGTIGTWTAGITNLLSAGGQISCSNSTVVGWPNPGNGDPYELKIGLPVSLSSSVGISQVLTNSLVPNSVYTLTVDISQGSTLNLGSSAALSLYAVGSTNLATVSGTTLTSILNTSSSFQTVTLTYKTGNAVPTNAIGVSLGATGVASAGASLLVDDFQLTVNPIQVQLGSSFAVGNNGSSGTITLTGQNGAPGATYYIQTTSNLLQTASWSQMVSGQFDTNGNFSQTFTINTQVPYRFFRTVLP